MNSKWQVSFNIVKNNEKKTLNLVFNHLFFPSSIYKNEVGLTDQVNKKLPVYWVLIGELKFNKFLGKFRLSFDKNLKIKLVFNKLFRKMNFKVFIIDENDLEYCKEFFFVI